MSLPIDFTLTTAGQLAAWNQTNTGLSLDITHIQVGDGNKATDKSETALLSPRQFVPIAAGVPLPPFQIRMSAIFKGTSGYRISEIGAWAGEPGQPGSVLALYWSKPDGELCAKFPGVDFIFHHEMSFEGALPAGALNIVVDESQSQLLAVIAAHESHPDPHGQYLTENDAANTYVRLSQLGAQATDEELSAALAQHVALPDPHAQYLKKYSASSIPIDNVGNAIFVYGIGIMEWQTINDWSGYCSSHVGCILPFALSVTKPGLLPLTGGEVLKTTYPALYAAIGNTYGVATDTAKFKLPLLVDGDALIAANGNAIGSLSGGTLIKHKHTAWTDAQGLHSHAVYDPGHNHANGSPENGWDGGYAVGYGSQALHRSNTGISGTGIGIYHDGTHAHNVGIAENGTDAKNRASGMRVGFYIVAI